MEKIALDSSLNELSIDALTVQICSTEPPLALFLFVLSFYGESLDWHGYVTVLSTDALQALLDRARGELPSDTRTYTHIPLKIIHGKISEIWRLEIANRRPIQVLSRYENINRNQLTN